MKRLSLFLTSAVMLVIGLFGITNTPFANNGSDGQPPTNNATVFFEKAWHTIKVAVATVALEVHGWFRSHHMAAPLALYAATTVARDTQSRPGEIANYPMAAATTIPLGAMVALDASGNAVNASDTAALRVVGRAEQTVNNSAGSAGDLTINVARGVFLWANSGTQAVTAAYKDKFVYVEDNQTVAITSTNKIVAGRVIEVATAGVWVDSTDKGAAAAAAVTTVGAAVGAFTDPPSAGEMATLRTFVNALRTDVIAAVAKINGG